MRYGDFLASLDFHVNKIVYNNVYKGAGEPGNEDSKFCADDDYVAVGGSQICQLS